VRFPGYAPELNPDEGVWKLAKQALANGCPRHLLDLIPSLVDALNAIRKNPRNLRACIDHSGLPFFLRRSLHSLRSALYFEHEYENVGDFTACGLSLHQAVAAWEAEAASSRLTYRDDGAALTIQDARVGAREPEVRLAGVERALYLYCDQYRSAQELVREGGAHGWTPAEAEAFLTRLRDRRLVATTDNRCLGLALPAAPPLEGRAVADRRTVRLDDDERQAMREKVNAWGSSLTQRERAIVEQLLGVELSEPETGTGGPAPAPARPQGAWQARTR